MAPGIPFARAARKARRLRMAPGVFETCLLFALSVRAASSECLSDSKGAACESFDLLRETAVVVGAVDELEPFKIPPNCDCTCTPTTAPTPAPTEGVDIKDDPHIRNLAQEFFAVNQPGEYTLLRVPQDPGQDALLEVRGTIGRHNSSACKMYTLGVSLFGQEARRQGRLRAPPAARLGGQQRRRW